jgi:hypothetical protein
VRCLRRTHVEALHSCTNRCLAGHATTYSWPCIQKGLLLAFYYNSLHVPIVCLREMRRAALADDELILQCKFWKIPMVFAPPKEKADAAAIRQAGVRAALKAAEDAYTRKLNEPQEDMQNWFFHKAEKNLLAGGL